MSPARHGRTGLAVIALLVGGVACSEDEAAAPADPDRIVLKPAADGGAHTHAPGQGHGGPPIGDGTAASAGGYRLADVTLPSADGPTELSFQIQDASGRPVTSYVEEQTKLLHLYAVREDLSQFRHLHPVIGGDATWRTRVDLGSPGRWRVIAEFTPQGEDQALVLGRTLQVGSGPGPESSVPTGAEAGTGDDGVIRAEVVTPASTGPNGRLQVKVSDLNGEALTLGSYLGASAHLTGFVVPSNDGKSGGGFVHVHPYGQPEVEKDGTVLTFHTELTTPGDYRLFLQVRVNGLLHQVAVTTTVTASSD